MDPKRKSQIEDEVAAEITAQSNAIQQAINNRPYTQETEQLIRDAAARIIRGIDAARQARTRIRNEAARARRLRERESAVLVMPRPNADNKIEGWDV